VKHTRRIAAALLGVGCLCASGLSGQEPVVVASSRAVTDTGTTLYELLPNESDDVKAAIDRAISHMNFIVRPIARHRSQQGIRSAA